jgi:hypothetical protein
VEASQIIVRVEIISKGLEPKIRRFLEKIKFMRNDVDFNVYVAKSKMSNFSLLFMSMISSWCVIIRTSFYK